MAKEIWVLLVLCLIQLPVWGQQREQENQEEENPDYALLWKISGNGLQKPSWLFGTIHVRDERAFKFSYQTISALKNCDQFAMELNPALVLDSVMLDLQANPEAEQKRIAFADFLTPDQQSELDEYLQQHYQVPLEQVDPRHPEVFSSWFPEAQAPKAEKSTFLDGFLFRSAQLLDKPVVGLEYVSEQKYMLETEDLGAAWLEIMGKEKVDKYGYDRLLMTYQAGDLNGVFRMVRPGWTGFQARQMAERNQRMVNRVMPLMENGSVFMDIGLAHLPGDSGMIQLLREQGYTVSRVPATYLESTRNWEPAWRPLPWKTKTDSLRGFSVLWPQNPAPFFREPAGQIDFYPDVGSGNTYYAGFLETTALSSEPENRLKQLIHFLSGSGSVEASAVKVVRKEGKAGEEFEYKNMQGEFFRGRMFEHRNRLVIQLVGPGPKQANSQDAKRFFAELSLFNPPPAEWEIWESEVGAFSVALPPGASESKSSMQEPETGQILDVHLLSAKDSTGKVNFMMRHNLIPAGGRANNSNTFFEQNLDLLSWNLRTEILWIDSLQVQGYPAFSFLLKGLEDDRMFRGNYALRGGAFYLALVSWQKNISRPDTAAFLNSLKFIPWTTENYQSFARGADLIKTKWPTEPQLADSSANLWQVQDPQSGTIFYYSMDSYGPYAQQSDPKQIFAVWKQNLVPEMDSILKIEQTIRADSTLEMDISIIPQGTKDIFRQKILLRGQNLHTLSAWLPNHPDAKPLESAFFGEVSFQKPSPDWKLWTAKRDELWTALGAKDEAVRAAALQECGNIIPGERDFPQIKDLLSQDLPGDENEIPTIRGALIQCLGRSALPEALRLLQSQISFYEAHPKAQFALCQAIVKTETDRGAEVLLNYLIKRQPVLASDLQGFELFLDLGYWISAIEWEQDFDLLYANPEYEMGMLQLLVSGLDAGRFSRAEVRQILPEILKNGRRYASLENWDNGENKRLLSPFEYSVATQNLLEFFPFDAEVVAFQREMLVGPNPELRLLAFEYLQNNGHPVSRKELTKMAELASIRTALWEKLEELGREKEFPKKFRKQVLIAEGDLARALIPVHAGKATDFELFGKRKMMYLGEWGTGYLFLYKLEGEEGRRVAFSGLQPLKKNEFSARGLATLLYDDEYENQTAQSLFDALEYHIERLGVNEIQED